MEAEKDAKRKGEGLSSSQGKSSSSKGDEARQSSSDSFFKNLSNKIKQKKEENHSSSTKSKSKAKPTEAGIDYIRSPERKAIVAERFRRIEANPKTTRTAAPGKKPTSLLKGSDSNLSASKEIKDIAKEQKDVHDSQKTDLKSSQSASDTSKKEGESPVWSTTYVQPPQVTAEKSDLSSSDSYISQEIPPESYSSDGGYQGFVSDYSLASEGVAYSSTLPPPSSDPKATSSSDAVEVVSAPLLAKGTLLESGTVALSNHLTDLNERFQKVAEELFQVKVFSDPTYLIKLNMEFLDISRDFLHAARNVGKVIISEVYVPYDQKTIKPFKNAGGVIGGEKYIVHNILFKFAIGKDGFYGEDEAAKALNHFFFYRRTRVEELGALVGLSRSRRLLPSSMSSIIDERFSLIDYMGFRLVAMLLLPVGKNTLKLGSDDAGATVKYDDVPLIEKMAEFGKALNLAPHHCKGRLFYWAADMEGHVGSDGRRYLLDLSRTFPPVPPQAEFKLGHLYRLFRPEFVKQNPVPLCSDGFSNFVNRAESKPISEALRAAMTLLEGKAIPEFAPVFDRLVQIADVRGLLEPGNFKFNIGRSLHQSGINIRYLGKVRKHSASDKAKNVLLIEMAARTIKRLMRHKMRKRIEDLKFPLETPYITVVVEFINDTFSSLSKEAVGIWGKSIEPEIVRYFQVPVENFRDQIWRFPKGKAMLFDRICAMTGLKILDYHLALIYKNNVSPTIDSTIISKLNVVELGERVKHMNVISHAQGYIMKRRSSLVERAGIEFALNKFEEAIDSSPLNPVSLRNAATCASLLLHKYIKDDIKVHKDHKFVYYFKDWNNYVLPNSKEKPEVKLEPITADIDYVLWLFSKALEANPNDTHTLFQFGEFVMSLRKDWEVGEELLVRALEADVTQIPAWDLLIMFYTEANLQDEVDMVRKVRMSTSERVLDGVDD